MEKLKQKFIDWMDKNDCSLEMVSKLIDRIRIERETGIKVK